MDICSVCKVRACSKGEDDKFPLGCPSRQSNVNDIKHIYDEEENHRISYNSALVEKEGYCKKTRIEEIIMFLNKCGYKKIGFAYCNGLRKEMETIHKIFAQYDFEMHSAVCKCGSMPKETVGLRDEDKIHPGQFEAMCNPIGQAQYLNEMGTEFNIIVGLCVGHDTLFIKYSQAPLTVLAVKDRVTGHAPLMPVYLADGYYRKLFDRQD